jgi:putative transposase
MAKQIKYKSNNNIVFSCKYHIVWCPKYRIDEVEILEMETDND